MSERTTYPVGVPCWVDTTQPDPAAATEFYGKLFGWEAAGPAVMPGDPPLHYYVARRRGRDVAGIGSQPAPGPAVWTTYVRVDNADEAARTIAAAGGTVVVTPFDVLPAGRMAVVNDRAGATFCLWEAASRQGAQLVNEPSAWAMSALVTSDLEGAKAFYGEAFGWQTQELQFGDQTVALFRLPGFVGGEPSQPVPRDVVAVMMPLSDEMKAAGARPAWNVDFWTADAEAAAATASASGATIVAPLHEVAGFRRVVIVDPQGAVFSASQLMR